MVFYILTTKSLFSQQEPSSQLTSEETRISCTEVLEFVPGIVIYSRFDYSDLTLKESNLLIMLKYQTSSSEFFYSNWKLCGTWLLYLALHAVSILGLSFFLTK